MKQLRSNQALYRDTMPLMLLLGFVLTIACYHREVGNCRKCPVILLGTKIYSATQQKSRLFSRVACRLVFFHRSQKTPRRHTKTFCLASADIVHKAAYKYVWINYCALRYIEIRDVSLFARPNGDQVDFLVL